MTHFGMDFSLLDGLPDDARRATLSAARRRRFARREVLFHEGDPGDSIHLVVQGHIGLRVNTPLGDTAMLRVLGPGGFVGELALLDAAPRSATAIAIDRTETLSIHRTHFDAVRETFPKAHAALSLALAAEVRRLAAALVEAMYLPAEQRFWRRVLDMVEVFGGPTAPEAPIPLTQEELAQLAGATRPTVNRLLREAQIENAVALARGSMTVVDLSWVRRRAGLRRVG